MILGDLTDSVVSRGGDCTQLTESGRVNGMWPSSGTSDRMDSERFLSREGSGDADGRIPGAHEARS